MSSTRWIVACLIGALGSVTIWVATTYNNFYLGLGFISDSYLPTAALFLLLLLSAVANPLLRRWKPALALNRAQLVVITAILLVASVVPGQGLMRQLPYMLARAPVDASQNAEIADAWASSKLPDGLFPDRMVFGERVPAASAFIDELPPGASIPWSNWLMPLALWGSLILFIWLFMVGLAAIVTPQWQRNERLPFPLLTVYNAQVEDPEEGCFTAPLYRRRPFWVAVLVVFVIYLLMGFNKYFPNHVPRFPLSWQLSPAFQGSPLQYLPGPILNNRIIFVFVGMAFFMPTRISFSIWSFALIYGFHQVYRVAYAPPHLWWTVSDNQTGAVAAITVFIVWLGRAHWREVARRMFRGGGTPEGRRDALAGWTFACGVLGMFVWLVLVGVQFQWALLLVAIAFSVTLVVARVIAETGMAFFRLDAAYPSVLLRFVPSAWLGGATVFMAGIMGVLFQIGSRVNATVMASHALGVAEDNSAGKRRITPSLLVGVMAVGLLVCGVTNLHMNYHHSAGPNGSGPLNSWGLKQAKSALTDIVNINRDEYHPPKQYSQATHIAIGATAAAGLQWACLNIPRWPLHPIGILMVKNYYGDRALASVFIGWLLKVLILRFGGSRFYRAGYAVFMGLIMGEIFAAVFWGLVSAAVAGLGFAVQAVEILPS